MALSEEQLELLGNRLVPLYQKFERAVINDVVRRLVKTERLTETAEIMAETLRDKGFSPASIRAQVMKAINADKKLQEAIAVNTLEMKQLILGEIEALRQEARVESEQLWEEAGNMAFHEDLSVWEQGAKPVMDSAFEQIVRATSKRATDELLNLTKSLGFRTADGLNVRAERIFTHEMNMAFVKLSSGAYSYGQAIDEAVRELAKSGIRHVDFDSGVTRQLDTAVRNAVMTASAQLAGEITMHNVEQTGVEYVEVSAHWGAREGVGHANHAGWQGKVYRVQGADSEYEKLEEATGYPSDPKGLCGYNCRHAFYPFWPGISEPTEWEKEPGPFDVDGRTYTYYQATQEERRREREIRALKREEAAYEAAGLKDKAKEAERKIRIKTVEYKDFSEAVGIRAKTERLRVCEAKSNTEVYRTADTHWKIGAHGQKVIPQAVYNRLVRNVEKAGGTVLRGGEDVERHLDISKANASHIGGVLMFRTEPRISDVLEEVHHFNQERKGLNSDKREDIRIVLNEIDAKKYLLSVAGKYKIPVEEVEETQEHLKYYEKLLDELEE